MRFRSWHLLRVVTFCAVGSIALAGCTSSTSTSGSSAEGEFVDSAVEGLTYSAAGSGQTDASGTFSYIAGGTVGFSVGGIALGQGAALPVMTPVNLVTNAITETDPAVTNIARFLQTIDDDGDPDNGIEITQAVRDAAAGLTVNFAQTITAFGSDLAVIAVVDSLTSVTTADTRPLVAVQDAQTHLRGTLLGNLAGRYEGNYTNTGGQFPIGTWALNVTSLGDISGTYQPAGSSPIVMTGSLTNSAGDFTTTASSGFSFTGRMAFSSDPREQDAVAVSGAWFNPVNSTVGTIKGKKILQN